MTGHPFFYEKFTGLFQRISRKRIEIFIMWMLKPTFDTIKGVYIKRRRGENIHPESSLPHEGKFVSDRKLWLTYLRNSLLLCTKRTLCKRHPRIDVTTNDVLSLINTTVSEVEVAIEKLSCPMAVGPDTIPSPIIEAYGRILSRTLTTIFSNWRKSSVFFRRVETALSSFCLEIWKTNTPH